MVGSCVLIERKGKVSVIKLNIPDKLNSLTPEMREDLKESLRTFQNDAESHVGVLTGAGRAFCAGGDLEEMKKGWEGAIDIARHMAKCNEITSLITNIPKPVIAAVNGAAVGAGFSMVMACDIVIASSSAAFSQVFAKVGVVPDMGSLYFLPRIVGVQRAKEIIWTARFIKADEALQLGIVSRVVAPEVLESEVMKLATEMADGPTVAFGLAKEILSKSLECSLQDVLQYEALAQVICLETKDNKEGVRAFFEKRKPVYTGR